MTRLLTHLRHYVVHTIALVVANGRALATLVAGIILGITLVIAIAAFVRIGNETERANARAVMNTRLAQAVAEIQARDQRENEAVVQASVDARYRSCLDGNELRKALRDEVREGQRNSSLFFRLLPQLDTAEVRALSKKNADRKLKAYAAADCKEVALAIVPEEQRDRYSIPQ